MKSMSEINEKLKRGKAVVLTAQEFKGAIRDGKDMSLDDVDVVTTATFGVMSGTAAILSVPVGERGQFKGAREVLFNDVPAFPGPCPNESVGLVEAILYGTASSKKEPKRYGGGHVFCDLVSGQEINVTVKTLEGDTIKKAITLRDLEFARMFTTRACFKNYTGMVNVEEGVVETIFSVHGLKGPYQEASVSGCGELNPLENEPSLKTIGVGTKVLLNGSVGYVTGRGTRSSRERPNLTLSGDMWNMKPECMGGFVTAHTPDCMTSVAIPIPVSSEEILNDLKILDEQIRLPIAAIHDRIPIGEADYGQVWRGKDLSVAFDSGACAFCTFRENCPVEAVCPASSFRSGEASSVTDCYQCGACISVCVENAITANLGSIMIADREIPITLRQSCRAKAENLATYLKNLIHKEAFTLTNKIDDV